MLLAQFQLQIIVKKNNSKLIFLSSYLYGNSKKIPTDENETVKATNPYTLSKKIAEILKSDKIKAELDVIFQEIDGLHRACPDNLGDWYFTGDYPTVGGNKVVNQAFINFVEKNKGRAYQLKLQQKYFQNKFYLLKKNPKLVYTRT